MKYLFTNGAEFGMEPFHFFASNWSNWRVHSDVQELLRIMQDDQKGDIQVWLIKKPIEAEYDISNFGPDLPDDDYEYLGTYLSIVE